MTLWTIFRQRITVQWYKQNERCIATGERFIELKGSFDLDEKEK